MTENKGWHGVDLDGTLAKELPVFDPAEIGEPIQLTVDRVKDWLARDEGVRVVTARVSSASVNWHGQPVEVSTRLIQDWTERHIGVRLPVTAEKDFNMIDLWDDRARQVEHNTGKDIVACLTRLLNGRQ